MKTKQVRFQVTLELLWPHSWMTHCLALPRSILMTEGRRSLTRTSRLSTRFCPLRAEHTLQLVFLSIAWCRQSSVSVVFLGVFFRQRCHVERTCRDYQLEPHGWSTVKRRAGSNCSNIELLVLCSVQLILNILLYMSILYTFSLLRSAALIVQNSHPYIATDQTKDCMSLLFNCRFK